ncbi:hypothetical protein BGZ99_007323 [Dissophora globulifera]|uniref:Uncharacterized protein n=1 Tax=Dissophora globulifera TaxID=979702 RepID=A0A9P6RA41_9FUNG|nr:hypothetical protein BGZ99_007323 [Dissophora globulifera]
MIYLKDDMPHSPFSSSHGSLSPHQTLELANLHLENASKTKDRGVALQLCNDAGAALSRIKKAAKKALKTPHSVEDQTLRDGVATAYHERGHLLEGLDYIEMAKDSYKKAKKLGLDQKTNKSPSDSPQLVNNSHPGSHVRDLAIIPSDIFKQDIAPAVAKYPLPKAGARLESTLQLVYCLSLLPTSAPPVKLLDEAEQAWSRAKEDDKDEQERLQAMATDLTKAFINDVLKSPSAVTEVLYLAPALDKENFRRLLMTFIDGINKATLLEVHLLEGLAQLIQCASPDYLDADDLVKILQVLSTRLTDTHQQSKQHIYRLTVVVSHVLDAMADCHVKGLNRVELHEPLSGYLNGLKGDSDPYLVYQAAYAFQALQYVPDDESPLQATLRRTRLVVKGIAGIVSAVKGFDVNGLIDGLAHLQDGIVEVYAVAKIGYDGAKALVESGQDLYDCLKEGLSFSKKRSWYPALRGIDILIRNGQLTEVKKLICEAPCRRDLAFQWGVCHRLGEIAANSLWGADTHRNAVDFLAELYKNDAEWGQQAIIKQWILNILEQLASHAESKSQSAETLLLELGTHGDIKKRNLYQAFLKKPQSHYSVAVTLPLAASPSLLDRVQNKPDIEADLRQLKEQRLSEMGDAVYIPPQAKPNLQASDDTLFPLMDKIKEFCSSDKKVLLLLGDSGSGKSTFNRALECDLWSSYKKKDGPIPLFINLSTIERPDQDLITKHLRRAEFTERQIKELKGYRRFVLICDGYDESQQTQNLYTSNRLNQPGEWSAQMVISCRSESLGQGYRDRFQPSDRNRQAMPELFEEAVIAPFSRNQVHEYIQKYVSSGTVWQTADYLLALESIPSLQDLVKNPFMLTLALEVLPRMVDLGQDFISVQVTRVALYDQFVEQWLELGKKRLAAKDLSSQEKKDFERLADDGFTQNGIDFLKDLACAIYKYQAGYPVVTYSRKRDQGTWKQQFFSREDENRLLLEACPLTRGGNQYKFIHKSILEYCLARAVFEPQNEEDEKRQDPAPELVRRGSIHSVRSFKDQDILEESAASVPIEQAILDSPLAWRFFVGEPSIIQFLAERVQQEPLFEKQLLAVLELSKVNNEARKAAANAITILVRAGVDFNRKHLEGIQIPGADLSGGQFDYAQLQGADLRDVNLRNVWLRRADLSNARMSGVQFGEWPYLQDYSEVRSCAFSPDGRTFAVGLNYEIIVVYDTTTWAKIHTLLGHTARIGSVTYSPSGHQIVSGSADNTVRLWDAHTGAPGLILSGHTKGVTSVKYSPNGRHIASGSHDETVRLWDAQTGAPGLILSGHAGSVLTITYSPSGHHIVSGGADNTVRLWDAQTGAPGPILEGHDDEVNVVTYSPNGHHIASGSDDRTVRVWDAHTGASGLILTGHTDNVYDVTYSPSGHQIASGGLDNTVRLWDAQTGSPGPIMTDHTNWITCVAYSPSGHQIASGSLDKTVRLWDALFRAPSLNLGGHTDKVQSVKYSPNGRQIASASEDMTVRLWEAQTGEPGPVLSGHWDTVNSVTFSPSGHQLASASDDETVRLWDAQTGAPGPILRGHADIVRNVTYSPNGLQVASGSWDTTVRLWDAQTGTPGHILSGHTDVIGNIAYSPTGHQIASGSDDKTVRLWDAHTGTAGPILEGHTEEITAVTYSPNGHQIASASEDMTVRLWDAQTGAPGPILSGHTKAVISATYSPSGHQIASGSHDGTIRLWDAQTGAPGPIMTVHASSITGVTYTPSGRHIVSRSEDATVRLWDADSGQRLIIIEDIRGGDISIDWSSTLDGIYFATGSGSSIREWKLVEKEDRLGVFLLWCSAHGGLSVSGTSIENAHGLSLVNTQLLTQRGAIGDPTPPLSLRDAGRKLTSIVSAVTKLKVATHLGTPREP